MSKIVPISREQLLAVPFLDMNSWTPAKEIQTLSFYVDNKWHGWIPANDRLIKVKMVPAEGNYFGDKPARSTDQVFRLFNLNAQRASFPEMRMASRGIWNDFQDLGTSLAKINLFFETWKQTKLDTERFVQTEIEFIVMVCRAVFDLLQEVIKAIWKRIELVDKSRKKQELPRSFADVVLHGDEPRTLEQIVAKYGLPGVFASWYISQVEFFAMLRKLRNDMTHGGSRAATMLFSTERGFAIFRHDTPWCKLYDWPKEVELQNELVPIRPAICAIISRTIDATNTFADMLETSIGLSTPLCPGLTYFCRGYSDRQLAEMPEVIQHSLWCDAHPALPEWKEADPVQFAE